MVVSAEGDKVHFSGLSIAQANRLDRCYGFEEKRDFPETCIHFVLQSEHDEENGLRPPEEVNTDLD